MDRGEEGCAVLTKIFEYICCAAFGDFATSHEFGRVAMALSERLDAPPMRALVTNYYGAYVGPWRTAMATCLPHLERSYTGYLETGALFMSAVVAMQIVMNRHFTGAELVPSHEYAMRQFEFLRRIHQPDQATIISCFVREMRALVQGPRSLPLFLATTQLALALFASLRKFVKASPPPEERERFVMLGRSSQSALDMLAPTGKNPTIQ